MCAYQSGKKFFTHDEIVEIVRKNVELYKDESRFADYIVDLALYLVEYAYKKEEAVPQAPESKLSVITASSQKLLKVFRSDEEHETGKVCPFCGAPNFAEAQKCVQCGQMI